MLCVVYEACGDHDNHLHTVYTERSGSFCDNPDGNSVTNSEPIHRVRIVSCQRVAQIGADR
ncbi:hypothetical protein RRG08_022485 [Elysia crispata]|uniref:Uncharacterized protein n=1 Tax=Elysia crispata TaxID=231223 RepID=A0AAE0Z2R6_9GAST|nr:hypothetical protein RRG08_022485 [Elysia crispata]